MANNGLKISQLVYTSLEDAVNEAAQVPLAIGTSGIKANRRIPIEELKGYQGSQGYQGAPGSGGGGSISGSGTATRHTIWTGATSIGDSIETEDSRGNIYIDTPDSVFVGGEGVIYNRVMHGANGYFSGNCAYNDVKGNNNDFNGGNLNNIYGENNFIQGNNNLTIGDSNYTDYSNNTIVLGNGNHIRGGEFTTNGSKNRIIGERNEVYGADNTLIGSDNYMGVANGERVTIGNDNRIMKYLR